jgi:sec-independent protein translocase protein TatA
LGEFSITHWLIILAILLLVFGPSRLPGLGSSLGKAIRGFKQGLNDLDSNDAQSAQKRPEQIETQGNTQTADQSKTKEPTGKS